MDKILLYPTYFPCILQMAAIAQSKSVVFELYDNYQKQTYRNRAYIAHSNGLLLLNVPVTKHKTKTHRKTKDIQVSSEMDWQFHHYKSIESAYRSAPFFEFYIDDFTPLFKTPIKSLHELHLKLFTVLCEVLDWKVDFSFTTSYQTEFDGLDLRSLVNAKSKVKHEFTPYVQVFGQTNGFYPNLSILDLIFNLGLIH